MLCASRSRRAQRQHCNGVDDEQSAALGHVAANSWGQLSLLNQFTDIRPVHAEIIGLHLKENDINISTTAFLPNTAPYSEVFM